MIKNITWEIEMNISANILFIYQGHQDPFIQIILISVITACSTVANCATCNQRNTNSAQVKCDSCNRGYYLDTSGVCQGKKLVIEALFGDILEQSKICLLSVVLSLHVCLVRLVIF